jgi:hypothetical protein
MLRAGNAASNTAADHVEVIREALRQLPFGASGRVGRKVLVRIDGAGCSHDVVDYLVARGMSYSVGFTPPDNTAELLKLIPASAWTAAYDSDGEVREGAWVAELTGLLDLAKNNWPTGIRVIVRKERPHPGAQLRITDVDGHRVTAFATNTATGGPGTQLPDLELRHRRRARCEDRIRGAKDTGLTNLPLHHFAHLDRDRRTGLRDHRLDAAAGVDRPRRTQVGTQTPPPAPVLHRRPARDQRPPEDPAPVRARALDIFGLAGTRTATPWRRRPRPADNHHVHRPDNPAPQPPGVEPGATETTSGRLSHPDGRITAGPTITWPDQDPIQPRRLHPTRPEALPYERSLLHAPRPPPRPSAVAASHCQLSATKRRVPYTGSTPTRMMRSKTGTAKRSSGRPGSGTRP